MAAGEGAGIVAILHMIPARVGKKASKSVGIQAALLGRMTFLSGQGTAGKEGGDPIIP